MFIHINLQIKHDVVQNIDIILNANRLCLHLKIL